MIALLIILPFILATLVIGVWAERKISGFIQDRLGPREVGFKGLLQTVADGLKLLQKEDLVPAKADKWIFLAAPFVIFVSVFAAFATMPLAPSIIGSSANVGVFFIMAIASLDVIGFLMAGWASNNKYSLLGAMRGVAQIISYEVPFGLTVLAVVMTCQTLNLQEINLQQSFVTDGGDWNGWADNNIYGGILSWNILRSPILIIGLIIFFISTLAESNRGPFDIPEAESEIIAGFLTEYSGFRWSIMMLAEYTMMILVAMLGVTLFLGGWNTPLPNIGSVQLASWTSGTPGELSGELWGLCWFFGKVVIWILIQIWVRWTYPRLRVDQLMHLSWKVLTPASLIIILIAGVWKMAML